MSTVFWLKFLFGSVNLGAIAYLGCCLALFWGQQRLIFFPKTEMIATPQDFDLDYEDRWIEFNDVEGKSQQVHGWWIPSATPSERALLYFHGNSCNISGNLASAYRFHKLGFSVFMIDYRGYGRSPGGFPSEASVYRDAQVAWDHLVNHRQVSPRNLYLFGHSLGGAIAIDLAVRRPQSAGLIVQNTFTSMRDMVGEQKHFHWFPINQILHQQFDSLAKLRLLQVPLLVIHATHDRTVPIRMGKRLYEMATVPKQYLIVPDAGHNNTGEVAGERYSEAIADFVAFSQPHHSYVIR